MSENMNNAPESGVKTTNFIHQIVENDLMEGRNDKRIHTRFPPEPNGYYTLGMPRQYVSISVQPKIRWKMQPSFRRHTNPSKEDQEYVDSIQEDVRWLGFDWEDRLYYASDNFDKLYNFAVELI
jgi:glutaminyl-tRNA synthetase